MARYEEIAVSQPVDIPVRDRGAQVASLMANGATGDGLADDRAVLAAVDALDAPMFLDPGKTFSVQSDITLTGRILSGGGLIKPASGVTVTINGTFDAGLYQVFDLSAGGTIAFGTGAVSEVAPEWFGAVGDAVTDDQPAIQAAVTATPAGADTKLSRTYLINDRVVAATAGVGIYWTPTAKLLVGYDDTAGYKPAVHVTADDVLLYFPRVDGQTNGCKGLHFEGVTGGGVEFGEIENTGGMGLFVSGSSRGVVARHTVFRACASSGSPESTIYTSSSDETFLYGVKVYEGRGKGIAINQGSRNKVHGCLVHTTTTPAVGATGIYINGTPTGGGVLSYDNEVIGCTVVEAASNGIKVSRDARATKVIGNTVRESGEHGILVQGAADTVVEGNVVEEIMAVGMSGVYVSYHSTTATEGRRSVITGNRIRRVAKAGIEIRGDDNLVEGNHIEAANQEQETSGSASFYPGIYVYSGDDNSVLGNRVRQGDETYKTHRGLYILAAATSTYVEGNDLEGSGSSADFVNLSSSTRGVGIPFTDSANLSVWTGTGVLANVTLDLRYDLKGGVARVYGTVRFDVTTAARIRLNNLPAATVLNQAAPNHFYDVSGSAWKPGQVSVVDNNGRVYLSYDQTGHSTVFPAGTGYVMPVDLRYTV